MQRDAVCPYSLPLWRRNIKGQLGILKDKRGQAYICHISVVHDRRLTSFLPLQLLCLPLFEPDKRDQSALAFMTLHNDTHHRFIFPRLRQKVFSQPRCARAIADDLGLPPLIPDVHGRDHFDIRAGHRQGETGQLEETRMFRIGDACARMKTSVV